MTSRRSTRTLIGPFLVGLPLVVAWGSAAQAADLHEAAGHIQLDPTQLSSNPVAPAVQTLIDHRWYVLDGGFDGAGDRHVTIGRIAVPATCKSPEPLLASLYNPAGYWIRRLEPTSNGTYFFAHPRREGRYLLKLGVSSPGCAGLQYTIVDSMAPVAAKQDNSLTAQVQECTLATKKVAADRYALGHRHSPATGKRYAGFLTRDLAAERRACPVHA